MSQKVHLLIVDGQNDFVVADPNAEFFDLVAKTLDKPSAAKVTASLQTLNPERGALVVPGALEDTVRLTKMINRLTKADKLDDITATMDSHQTIGIERPRWWKRVSDGSECLPFTCLGIHTDGRRIVKFVPGTQGANAFGMVPTDEEYTTFIAGHLHKGGPTGEGSFGYLKALAAAGRYPHLVWTEHCKVGSWGWGMVPMLHAALCKWERDCYARVNYVSKGNNPWTEHFSGVKAEVVDPKDPTTQVNTALVQTLEEADIIPMAGWALSHCMANTITDTANCFSNPKYAEKMVLLIDATSNVSGFEFLGTKFVQDLKARGMRTSTTEEFLA